MKGLISYWCGILSAKMGASIHLFFPGVGMVEDKHFPSFVSSYKCGAKISGFTKIKNLFAHSLFGKWTMQESLFFSKRNAKILERYCAEINPDYVVFDMIRVSRYLSFVPERSKTILNLNDLLSVRYSLQLNRGNRDNIFGQSSGNNFAKKLSKIPFLRKTALRIEQKRVYRSEIDCQTRFYKTVLVSEKEQKILAERTNCANCLVVPIGVDFDYFGKVEAVENKENVLAFLGNFNYGPNHSSAIMICENVLPKISSKYEMLFIGPATKDLISKYSSDNVHFLGMVDDFRPIIGSASIFLAPISYGTGIKTKIIEAMAMGKCVITNSVGAENIDANDGEHLFVRDSFAEISALVDNLLSDRETASKVGQNARLLIKEKYTYSEVEKRLRALFDEES